ncbi:MAG: asparagine synthase (glutamine-hydrolyzing) [Patescibacteria group bacterium]|jgi:asparagine synthase (glutamine-hydrolysing)
MCGISGLITNHPLTTTERVKAKQLNVYLQHRGPDGEGWHEGKTCLLGMRRLSIIDVAGGNQPLYNENKTIVLLFNGEIYNYVELRQELMNKGHVFRTKSDGETICHLYEEKGITCINALRGMFAITLFDITANTIYLIRDRLGEKPIYYTKDNSVLIYASEFKALKSITASSNWSINPAAIDLFLHYQYIPEPTTMVNEVHKIPAAHYLKIDLNTLETSLQRYWDLNAAAPITSSNPAELVKQELLTIGNIIGRSDVPIGIALSGGVDSSAVAALVKYHNSNKDITHAFTVGYTGRPATDERQHAKKFAKQLGIKLHEIEIATPQFVQDFPRLIAAMDDPISDIAAYSIDQIMQTAHDQGIKVMLNGVGGDEFFWGYQWIADGVAKTLAQIKTGQQHELISYQAHPDFKYAQQRIPGILKSAIKAKIPKHTSDHFFSLSNTNNIPIQAISALCTTWLYPDIIALGDRLSMAHSIELRSPFLDHKLVELVLGLNKTQPDLWQQPSKQLLKKAMATLIPTEILSRPKQGFTPPSAEWYIAVVKRYSKLLLNGYLIKHDIISWLGYFKLITPHNQQQIVFLYKCIVLEIWCRINLAHQSINSI